MVEEWIEETVVRVQGEVAWFDSMWDLCGDGDIPGLPSGYD